MNISNQHKPSNDELAEALFNRIDELHLETVANMTDGRIDAMEEDFKRFVSQSSTIDELYEKLDFYIEEMSVLDFLENLDEDGKKNFKILAYIHQIVDANEEFSSCFDTQEIVDSLVLEYREKMKDKDIPEEEKFVGDLYRFLTVKSVFKIKKV